MELFLEVAWCAGDMVKNKQPQTHLSGWKTPAVVVLGLTVAELVCGTQEPE